MAEDKLIVALDDNVGHTCVPVYHVGYYFIARQSSSVYHKRTVVCDNTICHSHKVIRTITWSSWCSWWWNHSWFVKINACQTTIRVIMEALIDANDSVVVIHWPTFHSYEITRVTTIHKQSFVERTEKLGLVYGNCTHGNHYNRAGITGCQVVDVQTDEKKQQSPRKMALSSLSHPRHVPPDWWDLQ